MKIKRIHFITGLTITVFIGFHLLNHIVSVFGIKYHIQFMNSLRLVYKNPIIETVLLVAVIAQIISGVTLFNRKRKTTDTFFDKLQIWTGLYLALFLLFHVGAVMVGRFILHLDTNFYFGAAGLNSFPLNLFFIPYYGLAIFSFFGHIAAIHNQKMKKTVLGLSSNIQSKLILYIGVIVIIIIFYGLTNGFNGIEIPNEYHIMIGK